MNFKYWLHEATCRISEAYDDDFDTIASVDSAIECLVQAKFSLTIGKPGLTGGDPPATGGSDGSNPLN